MRTRRGIAIALIVLLVAAAVLLLAYGWHSDGDTAPVADRFVHDGSAAMQLIISPHPDDEMQAVNALVQHPDVYTVWVTVTRGENTSTCNPDSRAWQRIDPDHRPDPPPSGRGTDSCGDARIASWHEFIDRYLAVTDVAGEALDELREVQMDGASEAWIGTGGARIVFDGGNGSLTRARVEQFLDVLQRARGVELPELPIERVIGASYANDDAELGAVYDHDEHTLLREVLLERDMDAVNGTWLPQPPKADRIDAVQELTAQEYDRLMGFTRAGKPVGAHQVAFRWLVFGAVRGNWAPSRDAVHHPSRAYLWPRRQHFQVVHRAADR